jgi:hypothetical protein
MPQQAALFVIRSSTTRRRVAWLAILAMALVALAPTIMRVRASLIHDQAGHAHHHHAGHAGDPAPDDCWRQCGYCDFLAQTPAIGSIDYVAAFLATHTSIVATSADTREAHASYVQAAQPRGPPSLI